VFLGFWEIKMLFDEVLAAFLEDQPGWTGDTSSFIENDEDFLESGVLDSFAFLSLTLHLEQVLGVTICFSETAPDELTRPSQLRAYFEARQ
jgi:acyl carrier protein